MPGWQHYARGTCPSTQFNATETAYTTANAIALQPVSVVWMTERVLHSMDDSLPGHFPAGPTSKVCKQICHMVKSHV
jgi:hypothetical protein